MNLHKNRTLWKISYKEFYGKTSISWRIQLWKKLFSVYKDTFEFLKEKLFLNWYKNVFGKNEFNIEKVEAILK